VEFAFTAVISLEASGAGTKYTALVIHGDEDGGKQHEAMALVEKIGLRALDAGAAHFARTVEALTPLLLELNRRYKAKEAGIRITGLPEKER
jgi:predicted dinucleotide-binding enzyme